MGEPDGDGITAGGVLSRVGNFLRKGVFSVISAGPMPDHIAFIMDGNRRYSRKKNMIEGDGHNAGFSALQKMLRFCFEMGVKYVTTYAFSIDNFRRSPEEVQSLMNLMQQKMRELLHRESMLHQYGVRVHIAGNLSLLTPPIRESAELIMTDTAKNTDAVLSICVAYTSTDEIAHAVQVACGEKCDGARDRSEDLVGLRDVEERMYMAVAPNPDIIIRTSGEMRLSNFLLWQSSCSLLSFPSVLWPEMGLWHLLWAVINFQQNHAYLCAGVESDELEGGLPQVQEPCLFVALSMNHHEEVPSQC